jgi:hypothetical protein
MAQPARPRSTRPALWLLLIGLVALWPHGRVSGAAEAAARSTTRPTVNVILWFDTEDYLLPADDDADKRLAGMLAQRHIRATFKVVGEKARVLKRRGRQDVIDALKQHDIGYHSNFHSVHPTPAEYLADCGLLDGIDEFVRHEARGAADVRRIFGVPSLVCYGQPGSSWAPQAIAALPQCGIGNEGIPCYLDSGNHIGLHGRPYWYCGALVVYDMAPNETRMDLFAPDGLARGDEAFDKIAGRLAGEGGGLISIYYHPCEWVHEQFWDFVNFRRGANPPREQWKAPPQRPAAETAAAFKRFGNYLDHMQSSPGVRFVTASQLPRLYPDPTRTGPVSESDIRELARRLSATDSPGIDFQLIGSKAFSPAEQFSLIADSLAHAIREQKTTGAASFSIPAPLLGPDGEPPATSDRHGPIPWPAFRDAALDAQDFVHQQHRVPARVFIGPDPMPPADFLAAMAKALLARGELNRFPDSVTLPDGVKLLTADHVVHDGPNVYGGWIVHRANFRAPHILDVARLQAWTLKPAIRSQSGD